MDEDAKEISYLLLQYEYLKRKGITDDKDLEKISKCFPENWFLYKLDVRLKLISLALKENKDLFDVCMENGKHI